VAAALEALVQRTRTATGIEVELDVDLAFEDGRAATRHTSDVESTIYRVVQEAMTNAVKHAGADHIRVSVGEDDTCVEITVGDDGRGFDPAQRGSGFGLVGMRERLAIVRGSLEIDTAQDAGTTVSARVPVHQAAEVAPSTAA